jgi:hypothetical protein
MRNAELAMPLAVIHVVEGRYDETRMAAESGLLAINARNGYRPE